MAVSRSPIGSRHFDLTSLAHPACWAALALLLVNDHVLKGGGAVPGWMTGKLSDFAFLVVAPAVLAAMLPRWVPGRRPIALVSVVGVFATAKLWRSASDLVVALVAQVGVAWKLWPDPTDLVALGVLPITVRVLYGTIAPSGHRLRALRERAGLLLCAGACLATSPPPTHAHFPFLLNATSAATNVRVTWVLRSVGIATCEDPASLAGVLNPNDLDDPRDLGLSAGQVAALDGPPADGTSPVGVCSASGSSFVPDTCVAAIFEAPPATPVLMVARGHWSESDGGGCSDPPVSLCRPMLNPKDSAGPDALMLRDIGGRRQFIPGAMIRIAPIDLSEISARVSAPNGCRAIRDEYRSLLASTTCASNADCQGRRGLNLPGEPSACGIAFATATSAALDDIDQRWRAACLTTIASCATYPQPAVCRGSRCAVACPEVVVPLCPPPCWEWEGKPASECPRDVHCMRPDGTVCTCLNRSVVCGDPPGAAPGCPLSCLDYPGGGTLDGGAPDTGASNDARATPNDAESIDAGRSP